MKIARYFVVGGVCSLLDIGTFAFLVNGMGWHYLIAAPIGFIAATLLNYYLSVRHVFESGVRFAKHHEMGLVFLVSGIGLALNQAVLYLAVEHLAVQPLIGKLIATGAVFFWNYGARNTFIFRASQS